MRVDAVRLNGRAFLNVSTGGVAAEATEETPAEQKALLGSWAYLFTALKKFGELEPVEVRAFGDGPGRSGADGAVNRQAKGAGGKILAGPLPCRRRAG